MFHPLNARHDECRATGALEQAQTTLSVNLDTPKPRGEKSFFRPEMA
jgi:hypothetical protein